MDSFNLLKRLDSLKSVPSNLCYGASDGPVPRYTGEYQGKWAIFTPGGWLSDYVDEAEIVMTLPQNFAVSLDLHHTSSENSFIRSQKQCIVIFVLFVCLDLLCISLPI